MERTRKIDEAEFLRLLTGYGAADARTRRQPSYKGTGRRRKRNKATRSGKNNSNGLQKRGNLRRYSTAVSYAFPFGENTNY